MRAETWHHRNSAAEGEGIAPASSLAFGDLGMGLPELGYVSLTTPGVSPVGSASASSAISISGLDTRSQSMPTPRIARADRGIRHAAAESAGSSGSGGCGGMLPSGNPFRHPSDQRG